MRTWLFACLFAISLAGSSHAEPPHKYGFLAETDRDLLAYAQKQESVVLACVYEVVGKGYYQELSVTVVDSFKGLFKKGDRILVIVDAEDAPRASRIGKLNYFFLSETKKGSTPQNPAYFCEWTAVLGYEHYGEAIGSFFRDHLH